ncbi:hypothetical protein Tco_0303873 [Tanacetum coccineum]
MTLKHGVLYERSTLPYPEELELGKEEAESKPDGAVQKTQTSLTSGGHLCDDCQLMVDVIILPTKVRNLQNERWRAMKHTEFSAYTMGTTIPVTGTGVFAAVVVLEVGILSFVAVTA